MNRDKCFIISNVESPDGQAKTILTICKIIFMLNLFRSCLN